MARLHLFLPAIMALLLVSVIGCSPAGDWGKVTVTNRGAIWNVVLENDLLLAKYSPARMKTLIKDRITEFRLKKDDKVVATALDGRHADKGQEFFRMTSASIEPETPDRKTVKLVFHKRVEYVSILKDLPALEIRYRSGGHNLDYGITGTRYVMYGQDQWQKQNGWTKTHPNLNDEMTESGSYYRSNWSPPGPLSYNGWMIMGVCDDQTGYGTGLLLPADRVRWLKLVVVGKSRGFERWMKGRHVAYLYATSGGADEIISMGKMLVDKLGKSLE